RHGFVTHYSYGTAAFRLGVALTTGGTSHRSCALPYRTLPGTSKIPGSPGRSAQTNRSRRPLRCLKTARTDIGIGKELAGTFPYLAGGVSSSSAPAGAGATPLPAWPLGAVTTLTTWLLWLVAFAA